jgi:nucleoside-diphosphate-sugar epimerase
MRILVTGASGYLGRFIVPALRARGHGLVMLGRHAGVGKDESHVWDLSDARPDIPAADALVHAAFDHVPGAYRGGEGEDPARFLQLNRDGSLALFAAARRAGVERIVFLSSRAVYGDHRRDEMLIETDRPRPDSLYGVMKHAVEQGLAASGGGISVRATGIYGRAPGATEHKWHGLFDQYMAGAEVPPRQGTELHGDDLASAILLLLEARPAELGDGLFNASDLKLDRHDLLARVQQLTGCPHALPARMKGPGPGIAATDRLRALGWHPGGWPKLDAFLREVAGRDQPAQPRALTGP